MVQIFGDFRDNQPISYEYLTLSFSPSSIPLKQRWRNNGLSADFLADYLTTFFPKNENDSSRFNRQSEIKSAASYIANELLENAMKFCDEKIDYPITIRLEIANDTLFFYSINSIDPEQAEKFMVFIKELVVSDPQEFYFRQLEKSADEDLPNSGLGFLTMINDYAAKIGWKFDTVQSSQSVLVVTTLIELAI